MGEAIGGGVEIECWREVVPVLFHEARRLTVHVQFRTLKFSMTRREFHIKLSSEEDHCFLYKTAITQEGYQRFVHYHNLDVPFEQFSDYMHHLVHAVKNGQDPGERFFINILAPASSALPQSIEFIVTQRQMGCVVQSRRLNLTFTLASDAELKEHLINCFDRLKREKDNALRRNAEMEVDLSSERTKVKELEERNRYLQRELEFSQTLLKSAENIQKHYESLLKQPRCKDEAQTIQNQNMCDVKALTDVVVHGGQDQQQLPLPLSAHGNGTSPLDSVMSFLTGNASEIRDTPSLVVPSVVVQQHQQQQQQTQPIGNVSSSLLSSDTKKLKGAAKRKASFHNLTNPNPANAVNSSLEQQQQHQTGLQHNHAGNHHQQTSSHHNNNQSSTSALHEHLARLHEAHHQQQQQQPSMVASSSSTSLINPITAMSLLEDRHDIYSMGPTGSSDGSYLGGGMMRDYMNETMGHHGLVVGGSMSPPLGNGNDLMERLSELNDNEWSNMKMEYGGDFSVDLADVSSVDNGYGSLHLNDPNVANATASGSDDSSPNGADGRNLNFDGVLSYFKCLICDGSFTIGSSHMVQHVSDSQRCNICSEIPPFDSKDELVKHMIGHSTRVYACQYCGKENPRVHYLKIHVRSHTGEKPYTCHQCGRGFADASTWRRHERVHTGEKPYQCNICGRKIARRDNVKIHMRSHMRTRAQLSCRTCGKPFSQANHLALHERICVGSSSIIETKPLTSSSPFPGSTA